MKIFAVLALLLMFGLVPAQADTTPTQTWNVVAMCDPNIDPQFFPFCGVPAKISAVFTTEPRTGLFFDPGDAFFFESTDVPIVTNITGTLDGQPMTLLPGGDAEPFTGWLSNGFPEGVAFVAGGFEYDLSTFGAPGGVFLSCLTIAPCGITPTTFIPAKETLDWSAVENVPEPSLFWMLLSGLLLLGLARWALD